MALETSATWVHRVAAAAEHPSYASGNALSQGASRRLGLSATWMTPRIDSYSAAFQDRQWSDKHWLMTIAIVLLVAFWLPTALLTVSYVFVCDRIVRHVSKREGRDYSLFWALNPRWHWEMGQLGWFTQAQDAGYGKALIAIYAGSALWFAFGIFLMYRGFP